FTWWVNKVDHEGNNIFEGGFLGLDNITVIERSTPPPDGATLEQSDATGWMGMYCLNMMRIALELAKENNAYEPLATKFFEHFVRIAASMKRMGSFGYHLWDEDDGFFYDVLRYPDGRFSKLRIRSLVGLIPLFAVERLEEDWIEQFPSFKANFHWFLDKRKSLVDECVTTVNHDHQVTHVLAMVRSEQMEQLLRKLSDPAEFWGPYGIRSLSQFHEAHPFSYGSETVAYEPGESTSHHKGGNSNWRGPVWMPTNFLMVETLRKLQKAYRDRFPVPDPADGQATLQLEELAERLANHLLAIFTRTRTGARPLYGQHPLFRTPPWQDALLFFEHFDAESGRGLGASHQTGWTGLVANLIDEWR
ncbi:MAG: glucosidase, partial [Planctomycetota bacterium]